MKTGWKTWPVGVLLFPLLVLTGNVALASGVPKPVMEPAVPVQIEVLPGEREKWVDPVLAEPIPVAVLGGRGVDVSEIDPATLVLAGAATTKDEEGSLASYQDVDGDGITDMLVNFPSRSIRLGERGARVWLSGEMRDGRPLLGSGSLASVRNERVDHVARVSGELENLPPLQARMDLLPGDPANFVELGNRGTVEVALLSAPDFDATRIDPLLLRLNGAPVTRRHGGGLATVQDVNGDGLNDLVVEVPKALLRIDAGAREVVLTGMTPEGRLLTATDSVTLADTATLTFDSGDPAVGPQPDSADFASTTGINILDAAAAAPYPSQIQVAGLTGVISKVKVTLKRLSHPFPADIDILLVGPTGQSLVLMSDVGSGAGAANVTLTFDDDAALDLDPLTPMTSGTYRPVNVGASDAFPAPAPVPSGAGRLQAFAGTNPNGTWKLFVVDDQAGNAGSIAGGWSVDFVMATEFCNAGPITINDAALATPYPSSIVVSNLTGVVSNVTAVLKGYTHAFPSDVDLLLAGPTGQAALLMSDAGGGRPGVSGVTLVLDDNAPLSLEAIANPASGTYRPTDFPMGETFPGAPPPPYPVSLQPFDGTKPNGTWNVFVQDDNAVDVGRIANVCLRITTMTPVDGDNAAAITIPAGSPTVTTGSAGPYPSTIDISGVTGTIVKATVTLRGLTHTFPRDLDILLQSPSGSDVLLMSDVGGSGPGVTGVTYTFDDDATSSIPTLTNVGSGTFKPSNDNGEGLDVLPLPVPPGPHGSSLVDLAGAFPNGTWRLFVFDDRGGDVGRISSGWSLTVRTWLPTFKVCNITQTAIPAGAPGTTQGPAEFYGSGVVFANGVTTDMSQYKVRVDLIGLTHSSPADLDVLLVGPQGQRALLMSDAGGGNPGFNNVNLSFDDDAVAGLAQLVNPVSGTYRPTDFVPGDVLAAPAPPGPYGTSLSVFKGTNPSGLWSLYVFDDAAGNTGNFPEWCLNLIPSLDPEEVPNLRFASKTTATWDAGPNATSYALYRGIPGQLLNLDDGAADACLRGTTLSQQLTGVADVPPAGSFFWYLVRGNNAQGEGPAGFQNLNGQIRARVMSSSGSCP